MGRHVGRVDLGQVADEDDLGASATRVSSVLRWALEVLGLVDDDELVLQRPARGR